MPSEASTAAQLQQQQQQSTSSHMMKTTKRGRPFLKVRTAFTGILTIYAHELRLLQDTLDLFATLIVSLQLTTHKQFFRTFANSFTT